MLWWCSQLVESIFIMLDVTIMSILSGYPSNGRFWSIGMQWCPLYVRCMLFLFWFPDDHAYTPLSPFVIPLFFLGEKMVINGEAETFFVSIFFFPLVVSFLGFRFFYLSFKCKMVAMMITLFFLKVFLMKRRQSCRSERLPEQHVLPVV